MIRIELEVSFPDPEGSVLAVTASVAGAMRDRLVDAGAVVHRITVEEADA